MPIETPTDRFRQHLGALHASPTSDRDLVDLNPASAFEAITRQMVETLLVDEMREIRARLNSLVFMMVGAIVIDILARFLGP